MVSYTYRYIQKSMTIHKECLAKLDKVYAINLLHYKGRKYCICASENFGGKVQLIDCETGRIRIINGLSGGVMCLVPIPEEEGVFLAIQKFYPIFQSEKAEIVKARFEIGESDEIDAKVQLIVPLPYVHRIMLAGQPGRRRIIAGTLCKTKQFEQDWSSAGAVYQIALSSQYNEADCVYEGIHKHHGMFALPVSGLLYVSGEQGVFTVNVKNDVCITEKVLADPVSDLCLFDIDGDGEEEMLIIEPFHGDSFKILHKTQDGWKCIAEDSISFGHAVWCGMLEGRPYAIVCSRGSDKAISLYELKSADGRITYIKSTIDSGVGAANIIVDQEDGKTVLYAANLGMDEVARYIISGE